MKLLKKNMAELPVCSRNGLKKKKGNKQKNKKLVVLSCGWGMSQAELAWFELTIMLSPPGTIPGMRIYIVSKFFWTSGMLAENDAINGLSGSQCLL